MKTHMMHRDKIIAARDEAKRLEFRAHLLARRVPLVSAGTEDRELKTMHLIEMASFGGQSAAFERVLTGGDKRGMEPGIPQPTEVHNE
jgi:hypothetical protein